MASARRKSVQFSFGNSCLCRRTSHSGKAPDRLSGLPAATFAGAFGTAATILAAVSHSYPIFLAAFGLGFGSASGMIYASALDLAAGARKPGVAAPAMVALFGLSGAIFGGLMR